jgi:hemerythrin
VAIHDRSVKSLAAEDYQLIEEEHSRLQELLDNLYNTCRNLDSQLDCQSCTSEKRASCKGQLISSLYNFIYLSDNHFSHEESIMWKWPHITEEYEQFRKHQQAHADIMVALRSIVDECSALDEQGKTAEGYRQLYKGVSGLLEEHGRLFDDPFIQSTRS